MGETTTAGAGGRADLPHHRKLRNYLIDASLQLRFATYLVAMAALLSGYLGWRLWQSYREASRLVALGDPVADDAIGQLLANEDRVRMIWLAVGLAGVVVCLLGFAVVTTHKVAGPALVLARTCRQVGEGMLRPPRQLRRGDLLIGLADDVARMVDRLRAREEKERAILHQAAMALSEGADGLSRAQILIEQLAHDKAERLAA